MNQTKKASENLKKAVTTLKKSVKVDPKTGKRIEQQPSPKEFSHNKKIQMRGHAKRAKQMHHHWGKEVSLAGDTEKLPRAHRYHSCMIKKCKKVTAWLKYKCKKECLRLWG